MKEISAARPQEARVIASISAPQLPLVCHCHDISCGRRLSRCLGQGKEQLMIRAMEIKGPVSKMKPVVFLYEAKLGYISSLWHFCPWLLTEHENRCHIQKKINHNNIGVDILKRLTNCNKCTSHDVLITAHQHVYIHLYISSTICRYQCNFRVKI